MAAMPSPCTLKPHALIVPIPAHSHIFPMLQLGFNLLWSGFVITFASPQRIHSHLTKHGMERLCQLGYGSADFHTIEIPDGLPVFTKIDRPSATKFAEAIIKIEAAVEQILEQMSKERPVTCIISNIFLFGMQDVANKFGLPKVDFFPSSAAAFSIGMHMFSRIPEARGRSKDGIQIGIGKTDQEELITGIPGLPPIRRSAIAKELWIDDISDPMHQILFRPYRRIRESRCILVNTFYELESEVVDALRGHDLQIHPVGPLLPSSHFGDKFVNSETWIQLRNQPKDEEEVTEERCMGWLREQEPGSVAYVAFGSLGVLAREEVTEIAAGLEESGEAFLWVVDAALLPKGFQERTRGKGMVVSWAPQVSVLGCGSVGAFLSHCGWNSTIESLSMGVPIIGWPLEQDQVTNLHLLIELWHVGVALPSLSRDHIRSIVKEVLHSPGLRAHVASLCGVACHASTLGSSVTSLQNFIDDICSERKALLHSTTSHTKRHNFV